MMNYEKYKEYLKIIDIKVLQGLLEQYEFEHEHNIEDRKVVIDLIKDEIQSKN